MKKVIIIGSGGSGKSTLARNIGRITVIYLDFPTIACLYGIFNRWIMYAGKRRPDMTEGCNEKIDWEFFNWVLTFRRRNRKKILAWLNKYSEGRNVIILKNRKQVNSFVDELKREN
jgi:adenylate kinase family enzyme